ncbi:MAG: decarboxylase [Lachnospiraceae bacterium]|jgi:arginine/lysine/ornithine decarboxylase|nr:decarboxylase [Lachnospiraceae bacterium]MCH4063614.1 decarboxylase [Lachnospiraceae bacterium]MCH4103663.1 decarboxylase [Lachnospiraceae bacterium]MCI1310085.1 decarboxylase [Lachnospiraceae bacterium]MCI1334551.1 decarboxylase [Lachnospiraceae bacterium]
MRKLEEELKQYAASDMYPFHMPGHKRRGDAVCRTDITEIDGFDNLHDPEDLIRGEMDFAKVFYGTKETYFLVNGSTVGILTAISAAVRPGGRILIERGCHISVYHAAYLRGLHIDYLDFGERSGQRPDAIVITSPTYEGAVKPVRKIAAYAHSLGVPLIVDEAHGAHFSMHPYFPESAVRQGADLVIQSTHKTLPALTQTALLHNVTGRVTDASIRKFLDIYETSSPSYILMSSITGAIHRAAEGGSAMFDSYAERLKRLRHELAGLTNLHLFGGEECVTSGRDRAVSCEPGMPVDPGKIVIETDGAAMTGPELYDRLRKEFHLQPEMKAPEYVILMTSVNDTQEGFDRLIAALREIDREVGPERPDGLHAAEAADRAAGGDALIIPERARTAADESTQAGTAASENRSVCAPAAMTIAEAADAEHEIVPLDQAAGRIAGDYIIVYPPDSPLVVPGERFTEENIRTIRDRIRAGLTVTGIRYGQMPEQDLVEVVAH